MLLSHESDLDSVSSYFCSFLMRPPVIGQGIHSFFRLSVCLCMHDHILKVS